MESLADEPTTDTTSRPSDTTSRHDEPTTDTTSRPPTRPADQPTPKGRLRACNPMQADAKGEKPMQADASGCKRKSKKAGVKGKGARGKQGQTSPKGAKG